jgi:hypothetical protein
MVIAFQYIVALTEKTDFTVWKRDNAIPSSYCSCNPGGLSLSMICRHKGGGARPCRILTLV